MGVEFIGMIATQLRSEMIPSSGPAIDHDYVVRFARAHEEAGFDRVLVGYSAAEPDGTQVAAYAAAHTDRLSFLIAHRPGFVFPTVAARTFATLDQFSGGRVAIHVISGGNDAEQRRDGDWLPKDDRYARTDEYLEILRRAWTETDPFDHGGRFYHFEDFVTEARCVQQPHVPVYFGGASDAAFEVGARHADTYALWGEPLAQTAEQIHRIRDAAVAVGRDQPPGISVSFRPILGATEDAAWERAHSILARAQTLAASAAARPGRFVSTAMRTLSPENVGSQRLLAAAAAGERHDRAMWTSIAAVTGAPGNSMALVGTPDTVARALLDYVEIGVTTLLIRGYDPLNDAIEYGRELLPRVRAALG